jgi:hypothetical protein
MASARAACAATVNATFAGDAIGASVAAVVVSATTVVRVMIAALAAAVRMVRPMPVFP